MVLERVHALGIAACTTMSGRFVPHAEMLRLVRCADVGAIPNLPIRLNEHARPTTLFEYVMLGVPVVSADPPRCASTSSDEKILVYRAGHP
jgi:hypothetical protein